VVSNGTFSKIAAPGLRLGWYELPQRVFDSLVDSFLIESGSGQNAYLSCIMSEVLYGRKLDEHVQKLRITYKVVFGTDVALSKVKSQEA